MRAVVTRVLSASVEIGGKTAGAIEKGFLVLLGVHEDDTEAEAKKIADKICGLRVFEDAAGKMNLAPDPAEKGLLIISQCIKGCLCCIYCCLIIFCYCFFCR